MLKACRVHNQYHIFHCHLLGYCKWLVSEVITGWIGNLRFAISFMRLEATPTSPSPAHRRLIKPQPGTGFLLIKVSYKNINGGENGGYKQSCIIFFVCVCDLAICPLSMLLVLVWEIECTVCLILSWSTRGNGESDDMQWGCIKAHRLPYLNTSSMTPERL